MTNARTSRTYAILGLIGGALGALIAILHGALWGFSEATVAATQSSLWTPVETVRVFAGLLAALGLVAVHERQADESGTLGLVGFVLTFVGLAGSAGLSFIDAFVDPILANVAPTDVANTPGSLLTGMLLVLLVLALGAILFGISIFRAGILPKWAGALLVVTGLLAFNPVTGPTIAPFLGGVTITWLCYALWTEDGHAGAGASTGAAA